MPLSRAFNPGPWWAAILVVATTACLPKGPPPAGRQLVTGRDASLAAIVSPGADDLLRVLVLRPGATTKTQDLSVISVDAANDASPEVPLISDIDSVFGIGCAPNGSVACSIDSTGIFQVQREDGTSAFVNAVTGEVQDQPPRSSGFVATQSDSGDRVFRVDSSTAGTLIDADGHTTSVPVGMSGFIGNVSYRFVGEDFYYLDPHQTLIDIPPSDMPQQVATGVVAFSGSQTANGPVLLVDEMTSDPAVIQSFVLEPASGKQTTLPFAGSSAELSPDGEWVLDTGNQRDGKFALFDYHSGTEQTFQIDGDPVTHIWRPGTAEVWMTAFDTSGGHAVWVLRPDGTTVFVPGAYMDYLAMTKPYAQPFTDDAVYWFYTTTSLDSATQVVQIARADDPAGPAFPLNPPSTFISYGVPLAGGKFLSTSYAKDANRADVSVLDLSTGDSVVLGRRGLLVATGDTRLLGIFHVEESRGDLTTIAFDTEQTTVLASEFTVSGLAEPQGTDALAPGTRIVYQFQARTASPYDGIWLATCP